MHGGDLSAAFCVNFRMCRKVKLWTGWLMFHWMVSITVAFNVDVESAVVYQGRQDSLFGFSVAAHRDQDTGWVLVGAPEAETDQKRWGVSKPGAVFRCQTTTPYSCQVIPFDTTGNINDSNSQILDEKSNQWFGATVASSGEDGVVVACAPRYVYFSINKKRREPVGTCFTAIDSFTRFSEYSPCRTAAWGYHRQGYCQAGFSAAATKERLFIGTPGSYYWQGQAYSQNLWNRLDLISTEEGPESEDNTYLGYSLALGDFTGDKLPDLAVGMPRGANLTGKVIFLTGQNMHQLHNLTGNQVGAYFGHAICVSDVNGDGRDDIVIGAPLHTDFSIPDGRYETGRIYVVYQNKEHKFRKWDIRDGEVTKGRFGFSLASLGDMDKDGYGDFAVGAPYSGAEAEGVVYIYRGSMMGVREKPSQVIYGTDVRHNIRSFGFSLAGAVDMDNNEYPDLLVGAAHSNQVAYFRARPVVHLEASARFVSEGGYIDMNTKNCVLNNGEAVSCVPLETCLEYTGIGVDKKMEFRVNMMLDTKKQMSSRMFFLAEEEESELSQSYILTKGVRMCKRMDVYLITNIHDKLTVLEATITHSLPDIVRKDSDSLTPVLKPSEDAGLITRDTINIQKDCGGDNVCIPDLKINYTSNLEEFSVGSEERLEISLNIANDGEDAYESVFYLDLPESVSYIKTEVTQGYGDIVTQKYGSIQVLCSPPTARNNHILKCDLGNPMAGGSNVSFRILLQPTVNFLKDVSSMEMMMTVNSSNPDAVTAAKDNHVAFSLPVRIKTDLRIRGISLPDMVRYNKSSYAAEDEILDEVDIGPEITHIYQVENRGPSDIVSAEVYILWPSFRQNDDPLLYLTAQPSIEGAGRCQYVSDVNTFNIKVDRYRQAQSPSPNVDVIEAKYTHEEKEMDYVSDEEQQTNKVLKDGETKIFTSNKSSEKVSSKFEMKQQTVKSESMSWRSSEKMITTQNRVRRDADTAFLSELDCGPTKCSFISCTIGPLKKKEYTLFKIRSRLWVRTLDSIDRNDLEISSKMVSRVTHLPYGVNPEYLGYRTHVVTSQVLAHELPDSGSIPIWILILAILAGLLFLGLCIYILYKCGFFKRQRPEDYDYQGTIQEKRPLGKESKNQIVSPDPHYNFVLNQNGYSNGVNGRPNSGGHQSLQRLSGSSNPRFSGDSNVRFSVDSNSPSRFSTSSNGFANGGTVYYPGQRHPDMMPGDEAL